MSHCIETFIFPETLYRSVLAALPGAHFVWSPQGFVMVPVTPDLQANLADRGVAVASAPYEEFYRLSGALAQKLKSLSQGSRIAYLETEYHEGIGSQAAILWDEGQVTLGPLRTRIEQEADGAFALDPPGEYAINRVLQALGVQRGEARDEFEAIGLRRHRSNTGWLKKAST